MLGQREPRPGKTRLREGRPDASGPFRVCDFRVTLAKIPVSWSGFPQKPTLAEIPVCSGLVYLTPETPARGWGGKTDSKGAANPRAIKGWRSCPQEPWGPPATLGAIVEPASE